MNEIVKKEDCCGCHACFNACPKGAITMEEDDKGFRYPKIDSKKCIDCGLCKRVCPVLKNTMLKTETKAYACYNLNEQERKDSSSGGIFILLAKEVLRRNGVVFGAAFDDNFVVKHIKITTEKDLVKLMGSKYVQSTIGTTYREVKDFLNKGVTVLYTGTPCQIEGLKSFLGKDYPQLYTQDIICHGVPSPKVWEKYRAYRIKKDKETPTKISFRNKDQGWILYNMKFFYNQKTYCKNQTQDLFLRTFLRNICLRDSCYHCHFKKKSRISDITLADYWGVQHIHKDFFDNKGTSLVLVNSVKGKELFDAIRKQMVCIETNFEQALQYNSAMISSVKPDKNKDFFFEDLDKLEFDELAKKYVKRKSIFSRFIRKLKNVIRQH